MTLALVLLCLVAPAARAEAACETEELSAVQSAVEVHSVAEDKSGVVTSAVRPNYKIHPGKFLTEGGDILEADMNLTRAAWLCDKISTCKGFTFEGSNLDEQLSDGADHKVHRVHFKSTFSTFDGDWTSYEKVKAGKGPASIVVTVPARGEDSVPNMQMSQQGVDEVQLSGQGQVPFAGDAGFADVGAKGKKGPPQVSFTCLTETYLARGDDLEVVEMLPSQAADMCLHLQSRSRPCQGWTFHGKNGTMANEKVLASPFFAEEQTVYFKFTQKPGSSANWASCIRMGADSAVQGANAGWALRASDLASNRPTLQ